MLFYIIMGSNNIVKQWVKKRLHYVFLCVYNIGSPPVVALISYIRGAERVVNT